MAKGLKNFADKLEIARRRVARGDITKVRGLSYWGAVDALKKHSKKQ